MTLCVVAVATAAIADLKAQVTYAIRGGAASFTAIGSPGFFKINGKGGTPEGEIVLTGTETLERAFVRVRLADLSTGVWLRDREMKVRYLEVDKYPDAVFEAERFDFGDSRAGDRLNVPGRLTLHGRTRPIFASVTLTPTGSGLEGVVDFAVDLADFGIESPSFSRFSMAKNIRIHAAFSAAPVPNSTPLAH